MDGTSKGNSLKIRGMIFMICFVIHEAEAVLRIIVGVDSDRVVIEKLKVENCRFGSFRKC